jgi:uncharacterized protein (TIGR02453 family)
VTTQFNGFPKQTIKFLSALERHNDREWFKSHKDEYEAVILSPAREYVTSMGDRLQKIIPSIHAVPMVDRSIFRMHRDTRFSPDKRPFKTHIGMFLWEGEDEKLDCPGFYLHIEKDKVLIGGGLHIFSKEILGCYRAAVNDDKLGGRLVKILAAGQGHFADDLDSDAYKLVPRGYPKDHPRGELLKKKGLTLGETTAIPDALHTEAALDYVYEQFEKIIPLHRWLCEMKTVADG